MLAEAPQQPNELESCALAYATRGFFVFPTHDLSSGACSCGQACPSPGKHPRTPYGFKDATTDAVTIKAWWRLWPNANIAIDCGRSGLVVVDVDVKNGKQGAATMRWFLDREEYGFRTTWLVGTPSGGFHFYFSGHVRKFQNRQYPGIDFQGAGSYVLAPPSVGALGHPYHVIQNAPIAAFPAALAATPRADGATIAFGETRAWEGPERPAIPYGEHRGALLSFTWHLRSIYGLTPEAGLPLAKAFLGALEGYNPSDPFTDHDILAMLRKVKPNVAAAPVGTGAALDPIVDATEVLANAPPPRQIVVPGLLVRGELHVFYGPDAVGKTSLVSYLLALVTRQQRDVLVFVNEDSPRDFAIKFALAGGDINRLKLYVAGRSMREFLLPKCRADLEAMLNSRAWGCVYFDSVNDLKSTDFRLNAADEARKLYEPLSTLAQAYDTAIVCTAHTNARDVLEGARQIRAKARVVARVERPNFEPETDGDTISFANLQYDPLWTAIVVTEKFSRGKPGAMYAFSFEERPSRDPQNGKYDYEIQPDGSQTIKMQYVCERHERLAETQRHIAPRIQPKIDLESRVYDVVRTCSGWPANDIYKQIGGDRNKVLALIKKAQSELGQV